MTYTDQTGRFPAVSSCGHKYIMILAEVDGNYIAMEPMKSKETSKLVRIYNAIIEWLAQKEIRPAKQMLDNDPPCEYLEAIKHDNIMWELIPPHNHRCNIAENGIQVEKGHIIANILGCDESFPIKEWHRLLPQIELTLNILCPSNLRPTISTHRYIYGIHDYNRMPLAPLGAACNALWGRNRGNCLVLTQQICGILELHQTTTTATRFLSKKQKLSR